MGIQTQQKDKWSNCRLAKTTMKRLDEYGEYKTANSYDKIVVKLLNIVEGKRGS
jgi:hypothetical protein